jgi:hypothetical protein
MSCFQSLCIPVDASFRLTRRAAFVAVASVPFVARAGVGEDSLRAVLTMNGQSFTFDANKADDLGVFKSPAGFTQSCLRATDPRLPLTVYFRPDVDTDRVEVVFEAGRVWDGSPANLGAYRVEITRGEKRLAVIEVPQHFWFSRWRWQSAARPIVAQVAVLHQRGLIPPLVNPSESFPGRAPASPRAEHYRVMELAGIAPDMGATGERNDIGLVTEHQARFLCTQAKDALSTLREQAEVAGTIPWHIRDERTGAPVDLDRHQEMTWYGGREVGKPHISLTESGIRIDSAHQPALAYVPYLLTGDPYHLEDLQFAANFNRGSLPPQYRLSIPQPRAFAWSLRTLAQAAKVTPDAVPQWLLPADYFRKDLDRTRTWFEKEYVDNPEPLRRVFRATDNLAYARDEPQAPGGTWISPWQHEFVVAVMGWLVLMGFEQWRRAFIWQVGGTLARTSDRSGWNRAYPSPYRLLVKGDKAGPTVESWAEAWRLTSARAELHERTSLADGDPMSAIFTRGALAMAVRLGVKDAQEPLRWLTEELQSKSAVIPYKWRLV